MVCIQITVKFNPVASMEYTTTAYCEVTGAGDRLPLEIRGIGVGPKAQFSYNTLDIGALYINAVHHYQVNHPVLSA